LRYSNDTRSNNLLEHPCAKKDHSTSAAATAVYPTFTQRCAIVIQAIDSLTQKAVLLRQSRPLRQFLMQTFNSPQQRDAVLAAVTPDA
jgi:hypothetical protein